MAFAPKMTYKGKPLVRCQNEIYYGSPADPFMVELRVLTSKTEGGAEVADKVHVMVLSNDKSKPLPERVVRQGKKNGIFNALSIGDMWMQRALQEAKK